MMFSRIITATALALATMLVGPTALAQRQPATPQPGQRVTPQGPGMRGERELARSLNNDLSGEYQAIIMYRTYASEATGNDRQRLRSLFEESMRDELEHAGTLADKVVALGVRPAREARPVPMAANNREMIENAIRAERQAIDAYTQRVREAEAVGDTQLKSQLEEFVRDETNHHQKLEQMLRTVTAGQPATTERRTTRRTEPGTGELRTRRPRTPETPRP